MSQINSVPLKFYGYLKKDFLLFTKRKKYLYLSILLPLLIAGIFLLMLNPTTTKLKVGVCDFDGSQISAESFQNLEEFEMIILTPDSNCLEELNSKIKSNEISMGLELGQGFSDNLENLKQSRINIYYDNTDIAFANLLAWKIDNALIPFKRKIIDELNTEVSSKISNVRENTAIVTSLIPLKGSMQSRVNEIDSDLKNLEEMDTEFLANPIWVNHKPIYDDNFTKSAGIAFIFPVIALFIILMLSSTSVIYDRKNNFITRVKTSTTPIFYIISKLIFFTLFTLAQFIIVLVLFYIYGAKYPINLIGLVQLIFFIGIINSLMGFIIGTISENEGIAVLFSLIISFPLMLLSGAFFPIQTMPRVIQYISKMLPLNYQIIATKQVLLFGNQISNNWLYFAGGLLILVWYLVKKSR